MLDIIRSLALVLTVTALHVVARKANIAECESEEGWMKEWMKGWIENPNKDCSPLIYCNGMSSVYCLAAGTYCAETCAGLTNIPECVAADRGWIANPNTDCSPWIYCNGQASVYCLAYDGPCAETCTGLRVETNIPECVAADPGWIANPNTDCSPWIYCNGTSSKYCLADYTICAGTCAELIV